MANPTREELEATAMLLGMYYYRRGGYFVKRISLEERTLRIDALSLAEVTFEEAKRRGGITRDKGGGSWYDEPD